MRIAIQVYVDADLDMARKIETRLFDKMMELAMQDGPSFMIANRPVDDSEWDQVWERKPK
jgi:hypothetical protein